MLAVFLIYKEISGNVQSPSYTSKRERDRQLRSLQSTPKSSYFHDRNVTRKKKKKSHGEITIVNETVAQKSSDGGAGEKRGKSIPFLSGMERGMG